MQYWGWVSLILQGFHHDSTGNKYSDGSKNTECLHNKAIVIAITAAAVIVMIEVLVVVIAILTANGECPDVPSGCRLLQGDACDLEVSAHGSWHNPLLP